jgi:SRSO17 transposase
MTESQIRGLGPALDRYLDSYLFCFSFTQTFEHLRTYCRGLLSDLERKSIEPIALASGTPVRTLQEFLRDHSWDHVPMTDIAQEHAAKLLPSVVHDGFGTIGIIDETSQPKKGDKTPGVQRQWCGRLGKVENCIVTVHIGVARGRFKTLVGGDLFLPEDWSNDRERCRKAGIPDEVVHRPKWKIALEQYDLAKGNGVQMDWLTFDEGYGNTPEFMDELDERRQQFIGEVPRKLACHIANGEEAPGQSDASTRAERLLVQALLNGRGVAVRVPHESNADEVWQAVEMTVWLSKGKGWSTRSYRLIAAFNAKTEEVKYFVSNAPAWISLDVLVRVAFRRAPIEHAFRIQKSELGFGHYEGRSYLGLLRHITVCCILGLFVAERAAGAQKKNAEVTVEQVCFALRAVNWLWLRLQRGLGVIAAAAETIAYHQRRNAAARASHKKRFVTPKVWIVPVSRMDFSPPALAG